LAGCGSDRGQRDQPSGSQAVDATGVEAVDVDFASQLGRGRIVYLRRDGLAQLVGQDECRLLLAIQIPAQLKRTVALAPFAKIADGE